MTARKEVIMGALSIVARVVGTEAISVIATIV